MKFNRTHFIGAKDCPFTLDGENLAEMRRARLNRIANRIKVEQKDTGNGTLGAIIVRCKSLKYPNELREVAELSGVK